MENLQINIHITLADPLGRTRLRGRCLRALRECRLPVRLMFRWDKCFCTVDVFCVFLCFSLTSLIKLMKLSRISKFMSNLCQNKKIIIFGAYLSILDEKTCVVWGQFLKCITHNWISWKYISKWILFTLRSFEKIKFSLNDKKYW